MRGGGRYVGSCAEDAGSPVPHGPGYLEYYNEDTYEVSKFVCAPNAWLTQCEQGEFSGGQPSGTGRRVRLVFTCLSRIIDSDWWIADMYGVVGIPMTESF